MKKKTVKKVVKIPENCYSCPFYTSYYDFRPDNYGRLEYRYCSLLKKEKFSSEHPDDCPLNKLETSSKKKKKKKK